MAGRTAGLDCIAIGLSFQIVALRWGRVSRVPYGENRSDGQPAGDRRDRPNSSRDVRLGSRGSVIAPTAAFPPQHGAVCARQGAFVGANCCSPALNQIVKYVYERMRQKESAGCRPMPSEETVCGYWLHAYGIEDSSVSWRDCAASASGLRTDRASACLPRRR